MIEPYSLFGSFTTALCCILAISSLSLCFSSRPGSDLTGRPALVVKKHLLPLSSTIIMARANQTILKY